MQYITKNSNNEWTLTLSELATLTNPTYLFKLTSEFQNTVKLFIAIDTSNYPDRYNKFLITESSTEILTSGTVELNPTGQWLYEVYEQTSTTNLNTDLCDNRTPLERGKVLVVGTDRITYKKRSNTINFKGYAG